LRLAAREKLFSKVGNRWRQHCSVARQFEDFQAAERAGAMLFADGVDELAVRIRVPADIFAEEWRNIEALKTRGAADR